MTEYVGREWRKIRIPWSNRETICNDKIHPQDVSAEQVQEDRTAVRQTVRVTYNSQGGRRGRPWGWWGRRGWHLPLSTLLYLHWTPHPGGQITHTHTHNKIQHEKNKMKHVGIARYLISRTVLQTWDWSPWDSFRVSPWKPKVNSISALSYSNV